MPELCVFEKGQKELLYSKLCVDEPRTTSIIDSKKNDSISYQNFTEMNYPIPVTISPAMTKSVKGYIVLLLPIQRIQVCCDM